MAWDFTLISSLCFLKEFRRVIRAFAALTASVLVACRFGFGVFGTAPTAGIIGNTCVGIVEERSVDCVLIGPVVDLCLDIIDNSFLPNSFNGKKARRA